SLLFPVPVREKMALLAGPWIGGAVGGHTGNGGPPAARTGWAGGGKRRAQKVVANRSPGGRGCPRRRAPLGRRPDRLACRPARGQRWKRLVLGRRGRGSRAGRLRAPRSRPRRVAGVERASRAP